MNDIVSTIKAIEEFIYELMVWTFFYPATIARIIFHPRKAVEFVRAEAALETANQFQTAIRPILLLLISLTIGVLAIPLSASEIAAVSAGSRLAKAIGESTLLLIAFRTIIFAVFPISGAILCDLATPGAVSRESLRLPFHQQCYILAPFALVVSPSLQLAGRGLAIAIIVLVLAHVWLLFAQYVFFRSEAKFGRIMSAGCALVVPVCGWLGLILASLLL